jgi:hypothetical protein
VELEVFVDHRAPVEAGQEWSKQLRQLPIARFRIATARGAEKAHVTQSEAANVKSFFVVGTIGADNRLTLPGQTFRIGEKAKLTEWLTKLTTRDAAHNDQRLAFGLTDQELVDVFDRLRPTIEGPTNGLAVSDLVALVESKINGEISIEPTVRDRLRENVSEELTGLSCGTVLAAALRPLGLVLVPKRRQDATALDIADVRTEPESWPVGWPPERRQVELVPKLIERLNAEIVDTSLSDVLSAIQPRLGVPFLFDQNSMTRQGIDPANIKVNVPGIRTNYGRVLDVSLAKGLLKSEIRVDEAGRAFIWISPLRDGKAMP